MIQNQIDEFIDYLKNVKKTSENTVASYKRDLVRLSVYLEDRGIMDASKVTEDCIFDYAAELADENFAPATITRHNTSIKTFFRYLLENGNIEDNPAERLKSPKVQKSDIRILSTVEIENLLSQDFGDDAKGKRDRAILELMYATGLKTSEIINLELSNVDLALSCLRLENGRIESGERLVPYGKKAKEALNAYLLDGRSQLLDGAEDSEVLFLNCSGTSLSRQGLWKLIKTYVKKAGIRSDVTPFSLRHSFAVHLVDNGADLSALQELLGYSESNNASRYIKKSKKNKDPFEWARIRN